MKTKGKRKANGQTDNSLKQEGIRMDGALKSRIFAYQKKLKDEMGLKVSFSEAARSLLEKALDAANVP
jgi:hypothetical protein